MTTLAPTHFCNQCGALWRQCDNGSWNLRSEKAGPCCDNVAMGSQIQPLVMPRLSPTHQSRAPRVIGEIRIDNHSKPYARLLTAYDEHGNVWREGTSIYAAPMPQAEPTSKGEPRVVVEVCPECDIDDCKHIRARREASQQREPQEAAELELLRDALRNLIETYGTDSPMWWQARAALSAPQEAGKPCATCRGKGFIIVAGNAPGGYEQEPCPDCDPSKEASKVEAAAEANPSTKVDDDFRPGNFPEGAGMWRDK